MTVFCKLKLLLLSGSVLSWSAHECAALYDRGGASKRHKTTEGKGGKNANVAHMLACDVPHIADIHDATLMPDDTHSDGVFAHFRSYIAIHFDAQLFQHQQPCTQRGERSCRAWGNSDGTWI